MGSRPVSSKKALLELCDKVGHLILPPSKVGRVKSLAMKVSAKNRPRDDQDFVGALRFEQGEKGLEIPPGLCHKKPP